MSDTSDMAGKRIKPVIGLTVLTVVLAFVALTVAYYVIDPDFSVKSQRNSDGSVQIEIRPNFVVGSVYEVTVTHSAGIIAHRNAPRGGIQSIHISAPPAAGSSVIVTCQLQYDRGLAACITTSEKTIVIP